MEKKHENFSFCETMSLNSAAMLHKKVGRTAFEKLQIIQEIENGKKVKDVCAERNIKQSTVSTIFKNREAIKRLAQESPLSLKQKKVRTCKSPELERAVNMFIQEARSQNVPLSGPIIQAKAKAYALALNVDNFEASNGWLTKFTARNGISFKTICGESKAVDLTVANDWMESVLPGLLENYHPDDEFNADETGLFFKCLPGRK
jgi:Tc5 transposase DNA-binding domain/CENP-B N-terminal DNA-binding domain